MYDINNIEIRISEYTNIEFNIIPNKLKVDVRGFQKDIDIKTIERLLDIICEWEYEYINDNIIDAATCKVKIFTNNGVKQYFMKGKFPNTYKEFYEIVRGIYG